MLVKQFNENADDDPLAYNEQATVSILVAAAYQADLIALAEFSAPKKPKNDGRIPVNGRYDIWLKDKCRDWVVEFKKFNPGSSIPTTRGITTKFKRAESDAKQMAKSSASCRYAGLIVPFYKLTVENKKSSVVYEDIECFALT